VLARDVTRLVGAKKAKLQSLEELLSLSGLLEEVLHSPTLAVWLISESEYLSYAFLFDQMRTYAYYLAKGPRALLLALMTLALQ
jgi:hypothetical protein